MKMEIPQASIQPLFCQFIFCNIIFSQFCNLSQKDFVCIVFYLGHPRPLFCLLSSFQTNIKILTTNKCENCPSSIWCWDLNSQPSEHESPFLTSRTGLPSLGTQNVNLVLKMMPVWMIGFAQIHQEKGYLKLENVLRNLNTNIITIQAPKPKSKLIYTTIIGNP